MTEDNQFQMDSNTTHYGEGEIEQLNDLNAYNMLKKDIKMYWQILEGLKSDEKVDIFIKILKKDTPKTRSVYQLRFLQQHCMQLKFFQDLSSNYGNEVVQEFVKYLRFQETQGESVIYEKGQRGSRFYIIIKGSVQIITKIPDLPSKQKNPNNQMLHAGCTFGETALLNNNHVRTTTIKSCEYCSLAYLEKEDFKCVLGQIATEQIHKRYLFIKDCSFLNESSYRELIALSYHFKQATYKRGEIVYDVHNTQIDEIYFVAQGTFILQGSIDVTQKVIPNLKVKIKKKTFNCNRLGQHTIFGLEYFNQDLIRQMQIQINTILEKSSLFQPPQLSSTINYNPLYLHQESLIEPSRIGRVICDSPNGVVYRVKVEEILNRLWKEESKAKFYAFSTITFQKQVKQILEFIKTTLEEKISQEIHSEQGTYLKPSIEYIGKQKIIQSNKDQLIESNIPSNYVQSPPSSFLHRQELKKHHSNVNQSSFSSFLLQDDSPSNNNDHFLNSSLNMTTSFKQPFQHIKNYLHSCLVNNTNKSCELSPRRTVKMQSFQTRQTFLNQFQTSSTLQTKTKNRSFRVFNLPNDTKQTKQSPNSSQNSGVLTPTEYLYGQSMIITKEDEIMQPMKTAQPIYSSMNTNKRNLLKQCSPQRMSDKQQLVHTKNEQLSNAIMLENEIIQEISQNECTIELKKMIPQKKTIIFQKNNNLQNNNTNSIFYFCHDRNKRISAEKAKQKLNQHVENTDLDKEEEEMITTRRSTIRKRILDDTSHQEKEDNQNVEKREEEKRYKYMQKLEIHQKNKFNKLFDNNLILLDIANQNSPYNDKVSNIYTNNQKERKYIFNKTAQIVKQQNCSYIQVREYFNRLKFKDNFFQYIFDKKSNQQFLSPPFKSTQSSLSQQNTKQPSYSPNTHTLNLAQTDRYLKDTQSNHKNSSIAKTNGNVVDTNQQLLKGQQIKRRKQHYVHENTLLSSSVILKTSENKHICLSSRENRQNCLKSLENKRIQTRNNSVIPTKRVISTSISSRHPSISIIGNEYNNSPPLSH